MPTIVEGGVVVDLCDHTLGTVADAQERYYNNGYNPGGGRCPHRINSLCW